MNCPRCTAAGGETQSAYRGGFTHGTVVALTEDSFKGRTIQRCPSCRGAFVEYEELKTIESKAGAGAAAAGAGRRAWDPPTEPIVCPSCQSETTRREWSIGTLLFVDVCIECRGIWLDSGELEAIGAGRR
jgi:Zn-finger nucleic acid-binding protein